jgi:hypothetical protein
MAPPTIDEDAILEEAALAAEKKKREERRGPRVARRGQRLSAFCSRYARISSLLPPLPD